MRLLNDYAIAKIFSLSSHNLMIILKKFIWKFQIHTKKQIDLVNWLVFWDILLIYDNRNKRIAKRKEHKINNSYFYFCWFKQLTI